MRALTPVFVLLPNDMRVVDRFPHERGRLDRAPMQPPRRDEHLQQRRQNWRRHVAQASEQTAGIDQSSNRAIGGQHVLGSRSRKPAQVIRTRRSDAALEHRYRVRAEFEVRNVVPLAHVDRITDVIALEGSGFFGCGGGNRLDPAVDGAVGRVTSPFCKHRSIELRRPDARTLWSGSYWGAIRPCTSVSERGPATYEGAAPCEVTSRPLSGCGRSPAPWPVQP